MFVELLVTVYVTFTVASGSPAGERIVNGTDAQPGEIPYIVSVRVAGRHTCGASILGPRHVLTAAHCTTYQVHYYTIQYGITHITSGNDAVNVIPVASKFPHEEYVARNGYLNDISVLELVADIPFGPNVQPIKLPRAFSVTPANAPAVLSGWGYPYTDGFPMTDLQTVKIYVYSDEDCERIHAQTGPTNRTSHLCAGVRGGGKGQCTGDSGGPLVVDGVQVGVVSWSVKPCAIKGYPGVFTKVANYIPWINTKAIK